MEDGKQVSVHVIIVDHVDEVVRLQHILEERAAALLFDEVDPAQTPQGKSLVLPVVLKDVAVDDSGLNDFLRTRKEIRKGKQTNEKSFTFPGNTPHVSALTAFPPWMLLLTWRLKEKERMRWRREREKKSNLILPFQPG